MRIQHLIRKYVAPLLGVLFLLAACTPALGEVQVAYLSLQGASGDLWITRSGEKKQVTGSGGLVYDFSISASGQFFVYSQYNQAGGLDLWRVSKEGQEARLLLECGLDWCHQPAISRDDQIIAYTRREFSQSSVESAQPRIWMLDIVSGQTSPLFSEVFIPGEQSSWSPDKVHLAFYDPLASGLRIVDMTNGGSQFIATGYLAWAWSPDGKKLAFVDLIMLADGESSAHLYLADIATQTITPLDILENEQSDYGALAWSPDGEWLVVSWRFPGGPPGKQLKMISLESGEEREIVKDFGYSQSSPAWSLDGGQVVFQRVRLGDSDARPELWAYDKASEEVYQLEANAALPLIFP